MNMLNVVGLAIVFVLPLIAYVVLTIHLMRKNDFLEKYILVQKDITAFNRVSVKPVITKPEDKKKEKENRDYADYMKVINSGVADEKDVKRFGTVTVDQG